LISTESCEEAKGCVTGIDGVLVFLLSLVERELFGFDESALFSDFGSESSDFCARFRDVCLSCL